MQILYHDPEILSGLGVKPKIDLPDLGENVQEHIVCELIPHSLSLSLILLLRNTHEPFAIARGTRMVKQWRVLHHRRGILEGFECKVNKDKIKMIMIDECFYWTFEPS